MLKTIKKGMVVLLTGLLLIGQGAVYADDKAATLTYTQALEIAIRNNLNIERTQTQREKVEDQLTTSSGIPPVAVSGNPYLSTQAVLRNITLTDSNETLKLQKENLIDGVTVSVMKSFYSIDYLLQKVDNEQRRLTDAREKLGFAGLRQEVGLASAYEVEQMRLGIKKQEEELIALKLELEDAYKSLANVMMVDKLPTRNLEKLTFDYKKVDTLHLNPEYQYAKAVSESAQIQAKKAEIREMELRNKWAIHPEGTLSETAAADTKLSDIDRKDQQQKLKFAIEETYNNLKKLETAIDKMNVQTKELDQAVMNMQTLYKVGLKTARDVQDIVMQQKTLAYELGKAKADHYMLLLQYQKPQLIQ